MNQILRAAEASCATSANITVAVVSVAFFAMVAAIVITMLIRD